MWYWSVLFVIFSALETSISGNMDTKALASSVAKFSAKFCNELDKGKSVVSSPLSAEFVLALLTLGTSEPAHSELLTALGIPDDDSIRSSFTEVSAKLKSIKGVTLNVANKVYINDSGYELLPSLKDDAVKVFDSDFEKVAFSDGAAAAELINKWVEGKTNNKIKDLLTSDSLDSSTRLVLVNALYFKGSWEKKFNPSLTRDKPFFLTTESQVNVPMMHAEGKYKYGESSELQAQLLELPYQGGEASMVVILPNDIEGLDAVMTKLADGHDLMTDLSRMMSVTVNVSLPKFKIESEIDLKSLLPKLCIKAIFDKANSGLTKILNCAEPLFVSEAIQKAFIEVNEEGAEAAAATGMVIMMRCAPRSFGFNANRPFFYTLLDANHAPLFVGVYRAGAA